MLTKEVEIIRKKADLVERENRYLRDQNSQSRERERGVDEREELRC